MSNVLAGAPLSREFSTFDRNGANADSVDLPVGTIVRNGVSLPTEILVVRVATGRYRYSTTIPEDSVSGDSIQIQMYVDVDEVQASDYVDEFTVSASSDASTTYAGAQIDREFPTFDRAGANADAQTLPVGTLVRNGVVTATVVTVTRVGIGRYRYSAIVPTDSVAGDSIQIQVAANVDGATTSDQVDEFMVGSTTAIDEDELSIVRPETPTYDGCEIFDKLRAVIVPAGGAATAEWQLLTKNGRPIALSTSDGSSLSISGEVTVEVYFSGCAGCEAPIGPVEADITVPGEGMVRFAIPDEVADEAGIYQMQIGVISSTSPGRPVFVDRGLLSVERSAWGTSPVDTGPPTLNEIRTAIRDNATENVYRSAVEYSIDEVFFSIIQPIREWNETPPPVAVYNCKNFPFKFYWMRAIIAELMRIASHHYLRNKMQTQAAGMSIDDLDKNKEYMQLSELYRQEWRVFVEHKKVQINIDGAYGTVSSPYSNLPGRPVYPW